MPATAEDVARALEQTGTEHRSVADELSALERENAELEALLGAKGRAYVKMARAGLLPVGGGLSALVDHASRLERLRRALERGLTRQQVIAKERVRLIHQKEALDDRKGALETEHAALARSHTAILAAEEREAAFRRAFLSSREAVPHTAVYGSGFGPLDSEDLAAGFAGMKGRLPFPIEGRVEIRPGRLPSAEGGGLEMVSLSGAVVRAVYSGRVAFADAYADYGRAVIVDHGGGYFSVSGNLGSIDVQVGDELRAGARIGTVGGGDRGSALYFELRHGKETVKPGPWFGI